MLQGVSSVSNLHSVGEVRLSVHNLEDLPEAPLANLVAYAILVHHPLAALFVLVPSARHLWVGYGVSVMSCVRATLVRAVFHALLVQVPHSSKRDRYAAVAHISPMIFGGRCPTPIPTSPQTSTIWTTGKRVGHDRSTLSGVRPTAQEHQHAGALPAVYSVNAQPLEWCQRACWCMVARLDGLHASPRPNR